MSEMEHETRFESGVLKCSCGWFSQELFWSMDAIEAAAQAHRRPLEVQEK